jgi:hypothetical protein
VLNDAVVHYCNAKHEHVAYLLRLVEVSNDRFLIIQLGQMLEESIKQAALVLLETHIITEYDLHGFYTTCGMKRTLAGDYCVVGWRKIERI